MPDAVRVARALQAAAVSAGVLLLAWSLLPWLGGTYEPSDAESPYGASASAPGSSPWWSAAVLAGILATGWGLRTARRGAASLRGPAGTCLLSAGGLLLCLVEVVRVLHAPTVVSVVSANIAADAYVRRVHWGHPELRYPVGGSSAMAGLAVGLALLALQVLLSLAALRLRQRAQRCVAT